MDVRRQETAVTYSRTGRRSVQLYTCKVGNEERGQLGPILPSLCALRIPQASVLDKKLKNSRRLGLWPNVETLRRLSLQKESLSVMTYL